MIKEQKIYVELENNNLEIVLLKKCKDCDNYHYEGLPSKEAKGILCLLGIHGMIDNNGRCVECGAYVG